MVKVLMPLVKVRGHGLSGGVFGCVEAIFGRGLSGRDCWALVVPQRREVTRNTTAQETCGTLSVSRVGWLFNWPSEDSALPPWLGRQQFCHPLDPIELCLLTATGRLVWVHRA